jgi:8-oxo-dGTP pyrophosphatase MutT (NUDIX family)
MNLENVISKISLRLKGSLPGRNIQLSLYSETWLRDYESRIKEFEDRNTPTKQSSVIILLYQLNNEIYFPLIKRPIYSGVHSGQIGLPGGKNDPNDKDMIETALRECEEEIGIEKSEIHVLGTLTPVFIPPSLFWVNVVLGYTKSNPIFKLDSREVAQLIEFPLMELLKEENIEFQEVVTTGFGKMKMPGYVYKDHFIWGATSMILTELKDLIK